MKKQLIARYDLTDLEDELDFDTEYETFKDNLYDEFKDHINKNVYVNAKNVGWQNLQGSKEFMLGNTLKIFTEVIPNTNDLTFYLWKTDKNKYYAKCSHHDAPMGENYYYNIK